MNQSALVSVIVPVYNVKAYLYRCVDSIRSQTYENLEILLVDDGATDGSGQLCDEIAAQEPRVRVVHKENGGLSSARNAGLAVCTGDYIGFVDSDDWIAPDTYEYMLRLMEKHSAEAVQINRKLAVEFTLETGGQAEKIEVLEGKAILQHYLESSTKTGSYSMGRSLFRRAVLDGLCFREGKINEDIDYKYKALQRCSVYVESNLVKYFYFQSTGSLTTSGLRQRDFDLYDAADELARLTRDEEYGTIRFLGEVKQKRTAFSLLCKIAYYGVSDPSIDRKQIVKQLTQEHRKNLPVLLKAPLPWSRKIVAVLLAVHIKALELPLGIAKAIKAA